MQLIRYSFIHVLPQGSNLTVFNACTILLHLPILSRGVCLLRCQAKISHPVLPYKDQQKQIKHQPPIQLKSHSKELERENILTLFAFFELAFTVETLRLFENDLAVLLETPLFIFSHIASTRDSISLKIKTNPLKTTLSKTIIFSICSQ